MHPTLTMRTALEDRTGLKARFEAVRAATEALVAPLEPEDMQVQTMADVSPTKWHLAHVTWFFETFVLLGHNPSASRHDALFGYLFNSYYEALGKRWSRPERGLLSRPLLRDILEYRRVTTQRVCTLIDTISTADWTRVAPVIELGLHHEQQHQELLCMDIKHVLSRSPRPYAPYPRKPGLTGGSIGDATFLPVPGGVVEIGARGNGFAYDNEYPRHKVFTYPFEIASRPVSNGEFAAFIADGGYQTPRLWLSDGWDYVQREAIDCPLYWRLQEDGSWQEYTLHGLKPLNPAEPVCHVSAYEAAAYAEWAGCRLPTEVELELLAERHPATGTALSIQVGLHPAELTGASGPQAVLGSVWEWSASAYEAYPGFQPPEGPVGEYNGKFMSSQQVLRGGSCATPEDDIRPSYRNFFPPSARWQFSGIRLARKLTAAD